MKVFYKIEENFGDEFKLFQCFGRVERRAQKCLGIIINQKVRFNIRHALRGINHILK